MSKGVKIIVGTAVAAVVLVVAAIAIVILTRDDAPEAVDLESTVARIEAAESDDSTDEPSAAAATDGSTDASNSSTDSSEDVGTTSSADDDTPDAGTDETTADDDTPDASTGDDDTTTTSTDQTVDATAGIAGVWIVEVAANAGDLQGEPVVSFAGFRVDEVLGGGIGDFTAVGRTADVSGSLELTDTALVAATVEVTMSTLRTDNGNRDGQVRRALNTNDFPLAVFTLVEPVELPAGMADGEAFSGSAEGGPHHQGRHQPGRVRPAGSTGRRQDRGRRIQRRRVQRLRRHRPHRAHSRLGRGQRHHGVPTHLHPLTSGHRNSRRRLTWAGGQWSS